MARRPPKRPDKSGLPRAGPDLLPAAQYAARIDVVKSRMSAWFAKGMPFVDGVDDHGRVCKLVNPADADRWRMANGDIRIDGTGKLRGLDTASPGAAPAAQPVGDGVPPPVSGTAPASSRAGAAPPAAAASGDAVADAQTIIAQSRAQEYVDKARITGLRLQKEEGKLVDRAAAVATQTTFVNRIGVGIDRMPSDMATVVAGLLGCTEHEAYQALKAVARRMREDLSRDAAGLADASRRAAAGGAG